METSVSQVAGGLRSEPKLLISPYGGRLIDLVVDQREREELSGIATALPSLQISPRSLCDLELLATGAFSPLDRFMNQADYRSVLEGMRLSNGVLFPIPVTLPVARADGWGARVALRSPSNHLLGILEIEEVFERDLEQEARQVCGTTSEDHILVSEMRWWGKYCLSGALRVIEVPRHYDFPELRRTPLQVREILGGLGHGDVLALHTREVLHRADEELSKSAARAADASLLIHPVVGGAGTGEPDYFARVHACRAVVEKYFDAGSTVLSLLPLAMRLAGPREAVWHAIIRRNYGANHVLIGRDYASPGAASDGRPFYDPDAAYDLVARFSGELGVRPVSGHSQSDTLLPAQVRGEYLSRGIPLPSWFTRPETAEILQKANPPKDQQGLCVWLTGLPSAGKSTIAEILAPLLLEQGRNITMLDGDVVRTHLSKGLGFSREDRDVNIRRIGFVAGEIARHNGTVIVAAVSPFNSTRNQVREMVGDDHFVLVYVSTPPGVCEDRDVKGFYAKARAGELKHFTGVDDPYEPPPSPQVLLETVESTPEQNAQKILAYLRERGYIKS